MVTRRRNLPSTERRMMSLSVPLTDPEIRGYGRKAAELHAEVVDKTESLSAFQKAAKAEIQEVARERNALLGKVREESEMRDVDVEVTWNFATNEVLTVRLDTGELVRSRAMTFDERQERLFEPPEAVPIRDTATDEEEGAEEMQETGSEPATSTED